MRAVPLAVWTAHNYAERQSILFNKISGRTNLTSASRSAALNYLVLAMRLSAGISANKRHEVCSTPTLFNTQKL